MYEQQKRSESKKKITRHNKNRNTSTTVSLSQLFIRPTVSYTMQGRIQGFAKVGGAVPPLLFLFPSPVFLSFLTLSPFPLEVVPLKPASGSGGALWAPPVASGTEPRPKTNLLHSKAVRKPLVAIILNILSTMFYSKTIQI